MSFLKREKFDDAIKAQECFNYLSEAPEAESGITSCWIIERNSSWTVYAILSPDDDVAGLATRESFKDYLTEVTGGIEELMKSIKDEGVQIIVGNCKLMRYISDAEKERQAGQAHRDWLRKHGVNRNEVKVSDIQQVGDDRSALEDDKIIPFSQEVILSPIEMNNIQCASENSHREREVLFKNEALDFLGKTKLNRLGEIGLRALSERLLHHMGKFILEIEKGNYTLPDYTPGCDPVARAGRNYLDGRPD